MKRKKNVCGLLLCIGLMSIILLVYIALTRMYLSAVKGTDDLPVIDYFSDDMVVARETNESDIGKAGTSIRSVIISDDDPSFRDTHFMTISGQGRLGNRMFEFAALLGVSHRHNYTPYILPRHPLVRIFELPAEYVLPLPKLDNLELVHEKAAGKYLKKVETLTHDRNYSLRGYYQSWRYFQLVPNLVKKLFKFKKKILRKAQQALEPFAKENRPHVGVHIRRSDMSVEKHLKRGYNVAPKSYFEKAFDFFRRNLTNPLFLIISDDMPWTKENMEQSEDVKLVSTGSPSSDLAVIGHCQHAVISSGSYGWWGGYLSGGTVVYFKNFPARGSWLAKRYNAEDYYPPNWIAME
ncbi:hypothetical protein FSP39_016161 [Pinctada imbricata]|uniref:L-Fucosyltransferase n=1 Tax=Pinctada imbricata TaxID=66713 RepID=A0AA89BUZ6_PINIB|nr:hypothetical protein FSP39_016161 [Pinctada imbricata]